MNTCWLFSHLGLFYKVGFVGNGIYLFLIYLKKLILSSQMNENLTEHVNQSLNLFSPISCITIENLTLIQYFSYTCISSDLFLFGSVYLCLVHSKFWCVEGNSVVFSFCQASVCTFKFSVSTSKL